MSRAVVCAKVVFVNCLLIVVLSCLATPSLLLNQIHKLRPVAAIASAVCMTLTQVGVLCSESTGVQIRWIHYTFVAVPLLSLNVQLSVHFNGPILLLKATGQVN